MLSRGDGNLRFCMMSTSKSALSRNNTNITSWNKKKIIPTKQGKNSVVDSVTYNYLYLAQSSVLGEIFSI